MFHAFDNPYGYSHLLDDDGGSSSSDGAPAEQRGASVVSPIVFFLARRGVAGARLTLKQ